MKKILLISLALMLAACSAVQPAQQEQPTPVIATVLITVIAPTEVLPPTAIPLPTQAPTEIPQPTAIPPTDVPPPTADTSSSDSSGLTPVHVDNNLGKGIFADIIFSSDRITLNCYPREIEISMKAIHPEVQRGEMWYRMLEAPSYFRYSDWMLVGNLDTDGKGNFFKTFSGTDITADWRGQAQAVVEFQFIGVNKGGGVVGRTEHIERMVMYYKECPPN